METYKTDTPLSQSIRAFRGFVAALPEDLRDEVRPHVLELADQIKAIVAENWKLSEQVDRLSGSGPDGCTSTELRKQGGSSNGGPPSSLSIAA